jgi:hypothetical protein
LAPPAANTDWTDGCIALTNQEIEEIRKFVPDGAPVRMDAQLSAQSPGAQRVPNLFCP